METKLERILRNVQKPARYTGGEYRQVKKSGDAVKVRVAFCFPDTYEIGMSNLGLHILYGVLNEIGHVRCERVFAPWNDMEEQMRSNGVLLYGLESGEPIRGFDIIAFSIGYELSYTNVLNMLDLAGISLRSADRTESEPLVIAGGTCCFNPEPLAEFIDMFAIGEGEDVIGEIIESYIQAKDAGKSKRGYLDSAAAIDGVYVPSLYDVRYNADGTVGRISPRGDAPFPVTKRVAHDMDAAYYPVEPIVPSTGIVHDRIALELFRGCIHGCRFCQAGHVYRPVRQRSPETLIRQGIDALKSSGYDELALSSLSSSDYSRLDELCDGLLEWCEPRRISLSLPSLRADNFSTGLMERVQKVRRAGLTFAPEAGSQRLRDVINKNVTEKELLDTCRIAFEGGWNSVKLYFMLGLPTETDEDVLAIAELSRAVLNTWKKYAAMKSRGVKITVSTSFFIPKPHTPFQWEAQIPMEEYARRTELLRNAMRTKAIKYSWHDPDQSLVEAALARGDRRSGAVIEAAWRNGARLDSWNEHFKMERWMEAFRQLGADPMFYAGRERPREEALPWSVVSAGLYEGYLWKQREASREGVTTPPCSVKCAGCGASGLLKDGADCDVRKEVYRGGAKSGAQSAV